MRKHGRELHAAAGAAAEAQRSLENGVARADGTWSDSVRRRFEADHLAAIRADARHLRLELEAIAADAERVAGTLRRT